MMEEVYVAGALRTPFGAFCGSLAGIEAPRLAAEVIRGLIERSGIPPEAVDEVIIGQVLSGGCGQAPARQALRMARLPDSTHAMTINKVCGSGLKSVMLAADSIRLGDSRMAVAGGMESMSMAPYFLRKGREGYRLGHGELLDMMLFDGLRDPYSGRLMGQIGEAAAARRGLTRRDLDSFAIRSYMRAREAVTKGLYRDEIVPVTRKVKGGEEQVETDEEPFRTDLNVLPGLRPAFSENGVITAGNASTLSDGAAFLLLACERALQEHGLEPMARLVASASESRHPDCFPEAPEGAILRACARAGLSTGDIDLFEINEAFASVPLAVVRELKLEMEKINVNGGAVALGHPIGASGGRLAATLVRELSRRGLRYGLATLCIGGGEAVAVIFERV
jgi:acetyl-CoA C-acetyltransferase